MRHGWHQEDIRSPARRWRLDRGPLLEILLLEVPFASVQLPVVVDGDGLAAVDKILDVRDEGFTTSGNVLPDILAPVDGVKLVLFE